MLFSYYFDTEKTHKLNCHFQIVTYIEKEDGSTEVLFNAEIAEYHNNIRLKREIRKATFTFPALAEGEAKHDIDFTRVRHGEQKKWIFTVINNRNTIQQVVLGLISETANKNPLGMDIYHDDAGFESELKANNLSVLEAGYVVPELVQTMANNTFDAPGYPERFDSVGASYDMLYRHYKVSNFTQKFLEPLPAKTKFKIEMDLAPSVVTPPAGTVMIFDLHVVGLGRISLAPMTLEYMIKDGFITDVARAHFARAVVPEDFFNARMLGKARLTIEGNGAGELTVSYNGYKLTGVYDHLKAFTELRFQSIVDPVDKNNWIGARLDNINVTYQK